MIEGCKKIDGIICGGPQSEDHMKSKNWTAPELMLDDDRFLGPVTIRTDGKVPWSKTIETYAPERLRSALNDPVLPDPDSTLFDRAKANLIHSIQGQLAGGLLRAFGRRARRANSPFQWIPRASWLREFSIDATPEPWRMLFSREGNAFRLVPGEPGWCEVWVVAAPRSQQSAADWVDAAIARQAANFDHHAAAADTRPASRNVAAYPMAETEAYVLVTTDWQWKAQTFQAGWVGRVSKDAAAVMTSQGVAVNWPPLPGEAGADPAFLAMLGEWQGGDLRTAVQQLVLAAPEVSAFEMFAGTAYALRPPQVAGCLAVARWRASELPSAPAIWKPKPEPPASRSLLGEPHGWLAGLTDRLPDYRLPVGRRVLADHEAARVHAMSSWRQRAIDRLMCEIFERLRTGDWKATGLRDDTAEALRVTIPPRCWDHPRYELTWPRDGAALRPAKDAPGNLPHYAQLEVAPAPAKVLGTAGAESRCRHWIADLALAHPDDAPKRKRDMEAEAVKLFRVNGHGFRRAWDAAAPDGWKSGGRRKAKPERN
jgi:hypothetical protein